jgi:Tol biopolymer transport system component
VLTSSEEKQKMISEVTPEVLADVQTQRDVRISPDGKHVVYAARSFWVRQKEHITASLWMAEVGKEKSAHQLTQGNFHDMSPTFSPDGKHIAFLSDRAKQAKASALYLFPVNGGEALPLTSTKNEKGVGE